MREFLGGWLKFLGVRLISTKLHVEACKTNITERPTAYAPYGGESVLQEKTAFGSSM